MLHRVVKPFPFSEDGFTLISLSEGDERDFGSMTAGLVAEGYIESVAEKIIEAPKEAQNDDVLIAAPSVAPPITQRRRRK